MQNLFLIIFYLYFINQCYLIKKFHFLKGFYFQFLNIKSFSFSEKIISDSYSEKSKLFYYYKLSKSSKLLSFNIKSYYLSIC